MKRERNHNFEINNLGLRLPGRESRLKVEEAYQIRKRLNSVCFLAAHIACEVY